MLDHKWTLDIVFPIRPQQSPIHIAFGLPNRLHLENHLKALLFVDFSEDQGARVDRDRDPSRGPHRRRVGPGAPHILDPPRHHRWSRPESRDGDRRVIEVRDVVGLRARVRLGREQLDRRLVVAASAQEVQVVVDRRVVDEPRVGRGVRVHVSRSVHERRRLRQVRVHYRLLVAVSSCRCTFYLFIYLFIGFIDVRSSVTFLCLNY